jgi:hypothetical protein
MRTSLYARIRLEGFGLGVVIAPTLKRAHVFILCIHFEIGLDY